MSEGKEREKERKREVGWSPTFYVPVRHTLITARCTLVQSAVLPSHVVCLSVCPSVCPSVCNVGEL